jgi:hypothetical protein
LVTARRDVAPEPRDRPAELRIAPPEKSPPRREPIAGLKASPPAGRAGPEIFHESAGARPKNDDARPKMRLTFLAIR